MKKSLAFILALIYLSTTIVAGFWLHDCQDSTGCSLSQVKSDCCKEAPGQVQAEHHLQGATALFKIHPPSTAVVSDWHNVAAGGAADVSSAGVFSFHTLILPDKVPLFLRNCNFRI